MENPLQILRDALEIIGLKWDDIVMVMAGISHPMAILDMADWVADHPEATRQELMEEKVRLIKKYQMTSSQMTS